MTINFLRTVWPADGYACIVGIKNKRIAQSFAAVYDGQQILAHINASAVAGADTYFAPLTSNTPNERTQNNACCGRTLFLDLDIDAGNHKKFGNVIEAVSALQGMVKRTKLPIPTYVINSGYGLHIYWVMDTTLIAADWMVLAKQFKDLLLKQREQHDFKFDPTVPADSARILRVPGTYNYKNPADPKLVTVLRSGDVTSLAAIETALAASMVSAPIPAAPITYPTAAISATDTTAALAGTFKPSSFASILARDTAGCAQLGYAVDNRERLEEPLWRAALSVADKCVDRIVAIELVSVGYPGYQFTDADRKAQMTGGPQSCAQFDTTNPGLCGSCPHRGRINSPISLGYIATAAAPTSAIAHANPAEYILRNEIPMSGLVGLLPWPYHRTTDGLYRELTVDAMAQALAKGLKLVPPPNNPTATANCLKVFDYDFALTAVGFDDDNNEEIYGLSVKLPRDPLRTQTMTSSNVKAADKFRNALHMGAALADIECANLRELVIKSVKHFRDTNRASDVVKQLGWTKRNTFCFGAYEIHPGGVITTVINRPEVRQLMTAVRVDGDPQVGVDAFKAMSAFWCTAGYEYGAMALASTFAAPLLHVGGVISGCIIHCYSPLSGRGKSALQLACLSVWGETDKLIALPSDTDNSTMHHINMLGSLPMVIEEITKMSVEDTGTMVYQLTHGREKRRMDGSTYTNKAVLGNYRTLTLTSGNASLLDKALAGSTAPDGLMYRIMEVRMDTPLPVDLDMEGLLLKLTRNHGAVGALYITWVVNNMARVKTMIADTVSMMEREWGVEKHERYWRETIAYIMVGMDIANMLNIAAFALDNMRDWIKQWYQSYKVRVGLLLVAARDILMPILVAAVRDTVFVLTNGVRSMTTGGSAQILFDHNTRELWVSASLLHDAVMKTGGDISSATDNMQSAAFIYRGKQDLAPAEGLLTGLSVVAAMPGYLYHVVDTSRLPGDYNPIEAA